MSRVDLQDDFSQKVDPKLSQITHDLYTSPTAKMDFLHDLLAQRGRTCNGMNWRLLLLEWRYDLTVLSRNVQDWMSYIDRQFGGMRDSSSDERR